MTPVEALLRWQRPVAPGPARTDLKALLVAAARALATLTAAAAVLVVVTPHPWIRAYFPATPRPWLGASLGSLVLVRGFARLALDLCRAPAERAGARAATAVAAVAVAAVVVGLAAHAAVGVAVGACAWLLPPLAMLVIAAGRSTTWDAAWPPPSPRAVDRAVIVAAALGALLAAGVLAAPWRGRATVVPGIARDFEPPAPWYVTGSDYHGYVVAYAATVGSLRLVGSYERVPATWIQLRGDVQLADRPERHPGSMLDYSEVSAAGDGLPWMRDEAVEVVRDGAPREVMLLTGSRAARFARAPDGHYGLQRAWVTAVAAPRRNAWGLLAGWALAVALAFGALWRSRRAVAALGPLDAWREGRLSVDGAIAPAEGGPAVLAPRALMGRAGAVVFRPAAAAAVEGDAYRGAPHAEAADVFLGTREELAAAVAQVRGAWPAWALVVLTAAAAPLLVALVTGG